MIRRTIRALQRRAPALFGEPDGISADGRFVHRHRGAVASVKDGLTGRVHEFKLRGGKDSYTIHEIFVKEAYSLRRLRRWPDIEAYYLRLKEKGATPLILDCGANIGASSVYLSITFPEAFVVALEPESSNAALHRANQNDPRIELHEAAIGPADGTIGLFANDNPRAHRVDASGGGVQVGMLSIPHLLERHREKAPFILKVDIEGFEKELFNRDASWIDEFPVVVVEPHDWMMPRSAGARNMLALFGSRDRDFVIDGENVVSISNALL